MSNPPREGGTPEVPINAPQGRPKAPPQGAPGQSQPAREPAPRRPQPSRQPSGQRTQPAPQGQPVPPRPQSQAGTLRQPIPPRGVPPLTTGSHGRLPASQQRQPVDLATRLDGQRGWLAQIDRSLKKRSIIALVLTCLAVGVGAAALYISLTKNSDGDRIDALQTRIEALEAAAGVPSTDTETVPGTDSLAPDTESTLPDTGVTLPEDTTIPPTGTTDESGLAIPAE